MQEQGKAADQSSAHTRRGRSSSRDRRKGRSTSQSRSRSRSRGRDGERDSESRYRYSRPDGSESSKSHGSSQSPPRDRGSHRNSSSHRDSHKDRDRGGERDYERRTSDRGYNQENNWQSSSGLDGGSRHRNPPSWRRNENDSSSGEPQLEIIMQGLPLGCKEAEIRQVVERGETGLEAIRLARDRHTGELRGFGFLKFASLGHAQEFMKQFSPSIKVGQSWVRIAYSNNPSNARDRRCPECGMNDGHLESCYQSLSSSKQGASQFEGRKWIGDATAIRPGPFASQHLHQQQQPYAAQANAAHYQQASLPTLNVGARDIGSAPNSILVVTDLPSMVNEAGIWTALSSLGPLVRIMLAKDRQSRISWGYCFAEFTDVKSAAMALDKANSDAFTIQSKPVEIHYAHHGSFIPAYAPTQWTLSWGNEGKLVIYWDEQAFLSVYVDPSVVAIAIKASPEATRTGNSPSKLPSKSPSAPADELDAFYAAMGDALKSGPSPGINASVFSVPTALDATAAVSVPSTVHAPVIQELPALPTTAKVDKVQLAGIAAAQAAEQLANAEEKKRKAGQASIGIGGGGKKVSIQLQKWSSKQVELKSGEIPFSPPPPAHHDTQLQQEVAPETLLNPVTAPVSSQAVPASVSSNLEADEFLDFKIIACLLCQRRLKTIQELRKHQALSDLHKKNLQDPEAIQGALQRVGARDAASKSSPTKPLAATMATTGTSSGGPSASSSVSISPLKLDEEPKYRDRAAERRQIFGQPDYPLPPTPVGRGYGYSAGGGGGGGGGGYGHGSGSQHEVIVPEQPTKDGIKEDNIGNRLLKSMGWKEGQGLGKDGDGIKAPIEASGYAKGVGIGASLVRKAAPQGNYALSAKELARRRYEESG